MKTFIFEVSEHRIIRYGIDAPDLDAAKLLFYADTDISSKIVDEDLMHFELLDITQGDE